MDFRRLDSGNPMSDKFRQVALSNTMQNIGSIRIQKDLKESSEDDLVADRVTLARPDTTREAGEKSGGVDAGETFAQSQAREFSGEQSVRSGRQQEFNEGVGEGRGRAEEEETPDASNGLLTAAGFGLLDEKDPAVRRKREEEARRLAQDDVPPEIFKVSKDIVQGQIHPVKGPHATLREMKAIPDVGTLEMQPVEFAPEMDIEVNAVPMIMGGEGDEDSAMIEQQ